VGGTFVSGTFVSVLSGDRSVARTFSITVCLLSFWLPQFVTADESTSIPVATPEQTQQTVERAIGYLQTESAAWLKTRKYAACHHVPMPLWALNEAERQGYAIDSFWSGAGGAPKKGSSIFSSASPAIAPMRFL